MNRRSARRRSLLAVVTVLVGLLAFAASAGAAKTVVYNNIVSPLPGNFASIGFEATSTSEYGGQIELASTQRKNPKVTVAMSTWACQYGNVTTDTCTTPKPNKKFKWPLTLNLYKVGPGNSIGEKIASDTHTFAMPYRPTVSNVCATSTYEDPGAWYDAASNECFHGMAFTVKFALPGVTLPSQVIATVAYNTGHHGAAPVGEAECDSTPQGCYYDSLNVAVIEPAEKGLTVGADLTETQYVNSTWSEMDCGKAELEGALNAVDCPSWYEGDQPAFAVEAGGK